MHQAKLALTLKEKKHHQFTPIKRFLEKMFEDCPHHLFQESSRTFSTKQKFSLKHAVIREKENLANRMARLVLQSVSYNPKRHEILQRFLLVNDSVTVAVEVPIYLFPEDIRHMQPQLGFEIPVSIDQVLASHIDFLQIRNGALHILDYKSNAHKDKPIEQLTLHALALSRLTGLRIYDFVCAWFDQEYYFEFYPLHIVYKKRSAGVSYRRTARLRRRERSKFFE